MRIRALRCLSVFAAPLFLLSACDDPPASSEKSPRAAAPAVVRAITLAPRKWTQSIRAHGVIEPMEEVDITVDFSATVRAVHFREGQTVKAGATLLEFDSRKRTLRLQEADAALRDVRAALDKAQDTFERNRRLFRDGTIPLARFQDGEASLKSARARMEQSLANRNLARREVGETALISPVAGIVSKRSVEPGETVLAGDALATVQAAGSVRVVTFVTEKDINALRVGSPALVTTPGVRGREYSARVDQVGFKADARTGNFPVKLALPNEDGLLRDGMTARVVLQGLAYEDALLVPRAALVDRDRRRVIFKAVGGRAVEVEPILAADIGDDLPVLDGLVAGDVVIVEGLDTVSDGARISVAGDGGT